MDQATPRDLRGRRKYLSASKATYIRVLLGLIQERFAKMTREPPQHESQLHGYWRRNSDDCFYVVHLKSDNTYDQNVYLRSSAGRNNPLETLRGTWKLEDGRIIWHHDGRPDPNPFVCWSSRDFVIREMDGSFTYWRSTAPDNR
jgi:hypothetical protein